MTIGHRGSRSFLARTAFVFAALVLTACVTNEERRDRIARRNSAPPSHQEALDAIGVIHLHYYRPVAESDLVQRCAGAMTKWVNDPAKRDALTASKTIPEFVDAMRDSERWAFMPVPEVVARNDACIDAMVGALHPLDRYEPAAAFVNLRAKLSAGIGVVLRDAPTGASIAEVMPESPALRGGLQSGDVIAAVAGEPVAGVLAGIVTDKLRGTAGSSVEVRVLKGGAAPAQTMTLVRADAAVTSVVAGRLLDGGVAHIAIFKMADGTPRAVAEQLSELAAARGTPLSGAIVDLRTATGPGVYPAVGAASVFLTSDATVLRTKGRAIGATRTYKAVPTDYGGSGDQDPIAKRPAETRTMPLVVLTSHSTAAGGEIIAAALQANGRARIVGTPTAGQGTLQSYLLLSTNGFINLTWGEAFAPDGRPIDGQGIKPDVALAADATLEQAITIALQLLRRQSGT